MAGEDGQGREKEKRPAESLFFVLRRSLRYPCATPTYDIVTDTVLTILEGEVRSGVPGDVTKITSRVRKSFKTRALLLGSYRYNYDYTTTRNDDDTRDTDDKSGGGERSSASRAIFSHDVEVKKKKTYARGLR